MLFIDDIKPVLLRQSSRCFFEQPPITFILCSLCRLQQVRKEGKILLPGFFSASDITVSLLLLLLPLLLLTQLLLGLTASK